MRRFPWQLATAAILLVVLAVLATLQYRWLGDVSDAERERLRAALRARAADFSRDFDGELTHAFLAFQFDPGAFERDPAAAIAGALARARSEAIAGGVIRDVFLADAIGDGTPPRRFDAATGTLVPAAWPPDFEPWRQRVDHLQRLAGAAVSAPLVTDVVDPQVPALFVPVPHVRQMADGGNVAVLPNPNAPQRTLVVWLDRDRLQHTLLPALVAKHFGSAFESEYYLAVVSRDDPDHPLYRSGGGAGTAPRHADAAVTPQNADVATGLFDLRMDEVSHFAMTFGTRGSWPGPPPGQHVAVTIVRRANGGDGRRVLMAGGDGQGAWQVLIRCKAGSLETLVARSRYRNLGISVGVLALLAGSVLLVMASAQRQQRLAEQQMEFVASVSHELRTPLAVIRSAGENLADGVVAESDQVRRYGSLIGAEGRRLTDMVERVMEFAGIASGAPMRKRPDVDVARLVGDAVQALAPEAKDRGVDVVVHQSTPLPPTVADADALRSAVQNVVGNAVKYSTAGGRVDVTVEPLESNAVRIAIADRGIGIDAADLPHVFEPFFRGRRGVEAQVRGTGIGLSVVRHVVRQHGGDVRVDSRSGGGTTVTIVIPVNAADAAHGSRVVRLRPGAAS